MAKKYILVERMEHKEFEESINDFLSEGWELHGATQVVKRRELDAQHMDPEDVMIYYQAMIWTEP